MSDEVGKTKNERPAGLDNFFGRGADKLYQPRRKPPSITDILGLDSYRICTEKTGSVSSKRVEIKWKNGIADLFVDGNRVDLGRNSSPILIDKRRRGGGYRIIVPGRGIRFKLGSAKPVNVAQFKRAIKLMVENVKASLTGPFRETCMKDPVFFGGRPTLYVIGKTDRLGEDSDNVELSYERAKRVAEALYAKRDKIGKVYVAGGGEMDIEVKYIGLGESGSETEDETASPEDRCVDFSISSQGPPFEGDWKTVLPKEGNKNKGGPSPFIKAARA